MSLTYNIPGLSLKGVANPATVQLVTQVTAKYLQALSVPDPTLWANAIADMTPTDALVHQFLVDLNDLDGFREWIAERQIKRTEAIGFALAQRRWERSKGIDVNYVNAVAAASGFLGFPDKIAAMMAAARVMRNRLVANVLIQGKTNAKTYQGIPLFVDKNASAKHLVNPLDPTGDSFPNLVTGMPFTTANLAIARQMINDIKAPNGDDSLELDITHVLGGTKMREPFRNVLEREYLGATELVDVGGGVKQAVGYQQSNIYKGEAVMLIGPQLDKDPVVKAGKQVWYATATNQIARPIEMIGKDGGLPKITIFGEGSEHCEKTDEILVLGKALMNAGAAFPQTIFRFES